MLSQRFAAQVQEDETCSWKSAVEVTSCTSVITGKTLARKVEQTSKSLSRRSEPHTDRPADQPPPVACRWGGGRARGSCAGNVRGTHACSTFFISAQASFSQPDHPRAQTAACEGSLLLAPASPSSMSRMSSSSPVVSSSTSSADTSVRRLSISSLTNSASA